jgi:hypothetical protein
MYTQLYSSTYNITAPSHAKPCMEVVMSIYMMHYKITTPQMTLIPKPNWVTTCREVILPIYPTQYKKLSVPILVSRINRPQTQN